MDASPTAALETQPLGIVAGMGPAARSSDPAVVRNGGAVAPVPDEGSAPATFSTFLALHGSRRPYLNVRGMAMIAAAVVIHTAAAVYIVVTDFMKVEELSPPAVTVSLLGSPAFFAPLPPPAPAPREHATPSRPRPQKIAAPRPPVVVEPQEAPAEDSSPDEAAPLTSAEEATQQSTSTSTSTSTDADDVAPVAAAGPIGGVGSENAGGAPAVIIPATVSRPVIDAEQRRGLLQRYLRDIMNARIARNRFYPPEAQEAGLETVVVVRLVVDLHGRLLSASVIKGDDIPILAQAALHTIRRSQPFPAPPAMLGAEVQVDVVLNYEIQL